ncbi:RES family NAD+ phosphorylase [Ramlibacter sp. USB13]|uniref:RES family NAD+ phosphorylase n=1 Tax=Ramlibacter cellulosilyticus TaxID=2764187 RepID=A0A923SB41_9BURK|nr:RES family NAD+ phosphorylase [Ramlibacter cellulosilyticus]MBC5783460.1 RES family NAD+ phosphorylase [Ramlibacter cellulosilyticus]
MPWQQEWLAGAAAAQRELWRGVEAQHRVATMRLVDNLAEQELLEQLLEASKPPLPPGARTRDYLLFTPFRYASPWPSRFRRPHEPGAWYGADEPATVAAELAHWRWTFFMDSDGLRETQLVTEHTFFRARFAGRELDLTQAPWAQHREQWRHPDDYAACQQLAAAARALEPPVQAIRYESARREGGLCQVVFDVQALALPRQHLQQTWVCKTTAALVLLSHDDGRYEFRMPAG